MEFHKIIGLFGPLTIQMQSTPYAVVNLRYVYVRCMSYLVGILLLVVSCVYVTVCWIVVRIVLCTVYILNRNTSCAIVYPWQLLLGFCSEQVIWSRVDYESITVESGLTRILLDSSLRFRFIIKYNIVVMMMVRWRNLNFNYRILRNMWWKMKTVKQWAYFSTFPGSVSSSLEILQCLL